MDTLLTASDHDGKSQRKWLPNTTAFLQNSAGQGNGTKQAFVLIFPSSKS